MHDCMQLGYRLAPRHFSVGPGIVLGCLLALACGDTTTDTGSESSQGGAGGKMMAFSGGDNSTPMGVGGTESIENGGSGGSRDAAVSGSGGMLAGGTGGTQAAGSGGARDGGSDGAQSGGAGGTSLADAGKVLFFDDFPGSSVDAAKWSVFDRISDQANGEINCCVPANVSVSGGFLTGVSKHEDHSCGDSQQAPVTEHYTSWHIQQKTAPFLYGTIEVRAKPPGGTGLWPTIWMLGYKWQASQPATANIPGHDWPHDGWCEIDIAEFWQNARNQVNCTVHFNVAGGLHIQALPFDATTRYMVYRLQWSPGSLIWSVDAEDGAGFRMLRTVSGAGNVPDVPMYVVINAAIGGTGGGTPNPSTFPQTFSVDWVRVTQ
jgi:beta-glucanase (GH16 family)